MMTCSTLPRLLPAALAVVLCAIPGPAQPAQSPKKEARVEYNRDVRPILSDNCFACHGPDQNKRKAKLRLDDRANALEKGAIVPGKLAESELINRILLQDDDEQKMPPRESHKKLTAKQIDTLKTWVEQGAEYQPHWAYIVPKRPAVPKFDAPLWDIRNPIDAFIFEELARKLGMPSKEADRRTLIRRLSLDLIGLPPTPAEVGSFVNDNRPNAYEQLVDRLLASPHFGERMATPWLDLVRFADTVGYHGDQNQRIFPYRDYVIDSFNRNKPFDQFTKEQLAGDLLPNPTPEQLIATGYHRLNMMTREGGAQPKEYIAKYQADRVRTFSMTWLGSTMGCAECHDHKYDPFTTRDFYSMSAFFADLRQWGVYNDYNYTPNPDLRGWSNDHPFPPEIEVDSPALKRRIAQLHRDLQNLVRDLPEKPDVAARWRTSAGEFLKLQHEGWGLGEEEVLEGKPKKGETHTTEIEQIDGWVASVRLNLLPNFDHNGNISRDGKPVAVNFSIARKNAKGELTKLPLAYGAANPPEVVTRYNSTEPVLGLAGGWRTNSQVTVPHAAVWMLDKPVEFAKGDVLVATVQSDNVGSFRVDVSPFGFEDLSSPRLPDAPTGPLALLLGSGHNPAAFARATAIRKELTNLRGGRAWTQVAVSQQPITTRILPRGNWMDETGPVVLPATPAFLKGPASTNEKRLTRLDLANWVTSKQNPLTARVFVNRLWKLFFGQGLSTGLEDVGAQGDSPSHPELLDWLAVEFAESWDVKRMVKLMVMSSTYRQDSKARPEFKDRDSNNRLLSFMNPKRLEAEFVRDNALAIAGLLNRDLGGPSVKPYQPEGYYANLQFPDRPYRTDSDARQYRRGLYVHWQRTFLHPMLANFDAPSREECLCQRTSANTPQQALTLLNDPTFVEAARVLAASLLADPALKSDDDRIRELYRRALSREPKAAERKTLQTFLADQTAHFTANPKEAERLRLVGLASAPATIPAPTLAAWASLCRVVLNLHETITRY